MTRATVLALTLLASCGGPPAPDPPAPRDPQVAQALDDPLMTDPDLSSRNEGAAALTVESDGSLPVLPVTPEAVAAARAEAAVLVGGIGRLAAPPAAAGPAKPIADEAPEAHLAALPGGARCEGALERSAIWAARLPRSLPVYPRGATLAAAGSDAAGCKARAITFTTPVPIDEVVAFYWARAAVLGPVYRRRGAERVVTGATPGLVFDVRAAPKDGGTLVRLATLEP
jgi:hypothetical protein